MPHEGHEIMEQDDPEKARLRHELGNARQEKRALQGMLRKAADEIEHLAEAECEETAKGEALQAAERFKRASST